MNNLAGKKIIVGISGSIAAYKSLELIRRLRELGAEVRVVMTENAQHFVTPLSLQAISGHSVYTDLLSTQSTFAMDHIELARWADLILIAPASANILAKLAHGLANDCLTSLCLATKTPIFLAPAMNQHMWQNSITQANIHSLLTHDFTLLGPATGAQACGDIGEGRLLEVNDLLAAIENFFTPKIFKDLTIAITAGPTQEAIDPIRYLSNHSSGKMGYALAEAAGKLGAHVILISGPSSLSPPTNIEFIPVTTANQMLAATINSAKRANIVISAAAVADYSPKEIMKTKIKKANAIWTLELQRNPDIIASVTQLENAPFTVGFAAETENLEQNALKKLTTKKLNMMIASEISQKNPIFNADKNAVTVFWPEGKQSFPLTAKNKLAYDLLTFIHQHYLIFSNK